MYYPHFCISLYTCANVICIKLLLTYLFTYLHDLIWHVISRSGVVISITNCYIRFTYLLTYITDLWLCQMFFLCGWLIQSPASHKCCVPSWPSSTSVNHSAVSTLQKKRTLHIHQSLNISSWKVSMKVPASEVPFQFHDTTDSALSYST